MPALQKKEENNEIRESCLEGSRWCTSRGNMNIIMRSYMSILIIEDFTS